MSTLNLEEELDAQPVSPRHDTSESPDSACSESTETQNQNQCMEILKSHEDPDDCRKNGNCPETKEIKGKGQNNANLSSSELKNRCVSKEGESKSQSERTESSTTLTQMPRLPPMPHDDWRFNHLLQDISKQVSPDQLDSFKMLFRGQSQRAISKRKFEQCTSCMKFFFLLLEMDYLGRNNTLYLQKLLFMMGNKELISKLITYCQENQTLYFFAPDKDNTDDGHTFVYLHVQGQDLSKFTPRYIREARETVAAILCIPAENVRIAGLQESDSFIITLLIPNLYVEILLTMLNNRSAFTELSDKNIDYIQIDDRRFYILDVNAGLTKGRFQGSMQTMHRKLHEDRQRKEDEIVKWFGLFENFEKQVTSQKREIDALKSELEEVKIKMHRVSVNQALSGTDVDTETTDKRNQIKTRNVKRTILDNFLAVFFSCSVRYNE